MTNITSQPTKHTVGTYQGWGHLILTLYALVQMVISHQKSKPNLITFFLQNRSENDLYQIMVL